jgi:hypothetical protein
VQDDDFQRKHEKVKARAKRRTSVVTSGSTQDEAVSKSDDDANGGVDGSNDDEPNYLDEYDKQEAALDVRLAAMNSEEDEDGA